MKLCLVLLIFYVKLISCQTFSNSSDHDVQRLRVNWNNILILGWIIVWNCWIYLLSKLKKKKQREVKPKILYKTFNEIMKIQLKDLIFQRLDFSISFSANKPCTRVSASVEYRIVDNVYLVEPIWSRTNFRGLAKLWLKIRRRLRQL